MSTFAKKYNNIIEKLKNIKYKEVYLAILVAAICLIIYFCNIDKNTSKTNIVDDDSTISSEISNILSKIDGVGNCYVYITYDTKEMDSNNNIYSYSNSVINYKNDNIYGVVVVCDGADDINVKIKVINAIKTLIDVDGLKIQVYKT